MFRKRDTKKFIEEAKKIHGDKYDYSQVEYISITKKVEIICSNHGVFEQLASVHLRGGNCPKCMRVAKPTNEEFIDKANKIHNNKYDYSQVDYKNRKTEITIICNKHGIFNQQPGSHLKGYGCRKCSIELQTADTQEFIKKAEIVYGKKYDYSEVVCKGHNEKVKIICKEHGIFEQSLQNHIKSEGCKKCENKKRTFTTKQFIEKAREIHSDKYDYSKTIYNKSSEKLIITCKIHGDFEQLACTHINNKGGCDKCGKESHWRRSDYIKKADGRICTFYTIRCFNKNEEFYKIGITMNDVKKRYCNIKNMPYSYEIVSEIFGEAGEIWDMEKDNIIKLKEFHYIPEIYFAGSKTECFTQYTI